MRNENRVGTEAETVATDSNPSVAPNNTTNIIPTRSRYRIDGSNNDEFNNIVGQTGMQLSMCFSVLVKLIDELILELICYKDWTKNEQKGLKTLLIIDDKFLPIIRVFLLKFIYITNVLFKFSN